MPNFTATSRVPTRPLSYANKAMAYRKELLVDYTNGMIYIIDENGNEHNVSEQVYNQLIENTDIVKNIKVTIPDGNGGTIEVTIEEAFTQIVNDIDSIKDNIDNLNNAKVYASDVITDDTHQFVTQEQLDNINAVNDDISNLKGDVNTAKSDISNLKGDVNTAKSDINTIKNDIENLKNNSGGSSGGETSKVYASDVITDNAHQFVTQEQLDNINAVNDDIDTAKSDISNLKSDINTAKSDISNLKGDVNTAKSDINTAKSDISNLKNNVTTINNKLKDKISIVETVITISPSDVTGSEAPYTCTKTVTGVDPNYPSPIIDIKFKDNVLANNNNEEDAFYCIYRCQILNANEAIFSFKSKPETEFQVLFQIKVPG